MAYVAVKGGEQAIEESLRRLKYERVKKGAGAGVDQIEQGMRLLVDQVMSEGSLYAPSSPHWQSSRERAVWRRRYFCCEAIAPHCRAGTTPILLTVGKWRSNAEYPQL